MMLVSRDQYSRATTILKSEEKTCTEVPNSYNAAAFYDVF